MGSVQYICHETLFNITGKGRSNLRKWLGRELFGAENSVHTTGRDGQGLKYSFSLSCAVCGWY
jgi:hypothetical protein